MLNKLLFIYVFIIKKTSILIQLCLRKKVLITKPSVIIIIEFIRPISRGCKELKKQKTYARKRSFKKEIKIWKDNKVINYNLQDSRKKSSKNKKIEWQLNSPEIGRRDIFKIQKVRQLRWRGRYNPSYVENARLLSISTSQLMTNICFMKLNHRR